MRKFLSWVITFSLMLSLVAAATLAPVAVHAASSVAPAAGVLSGSLLPAELIAGGIFRNTADQAKVKFTSDRSGDYYYHVSGSSSPPSTGDSSEWTKAAEKAIADTNTTLTATGLVSGLQYVHVFLEDGDGVHSEPITFEILSDFFYWENFESYPLGTTAYSGEFSPLLRKHSGTGDAHQKVLQADGGNTSRAFVLASTSSWAGDADLSLGNDFAKKNKIYSVEFKAQPKSGTWPGELRLMISQNSFIDALVFKFRYGAISIAEHDEKNEVLKDSYAVDQWYHFKAVVNTQTKTCHVYLDDEAICSFPAKGDYTYLNITAGHSGRICYDDIKIYELPGIDPLLQSSETTADGEKIILTFDKEMFSPAGKQGEFTVKVDGTPNIVSTVALGSDSKNIELTLTDTIIYGQNISVSYTAGTVSSSDSGTLQTFGDQPVTNKVPAPAFTFTAPGPISQNGLTAAVTFSPTSPAAAGTKVTASVSPTGIAEKAGVHTIDLTSIKAGLTTDPRTITVTAGQNLTTNPIVNTFNVAMPAQAVDDFVLSHTFSASLIAPELEAAVTSPDGKIILLQFDKAMADPSTCLGSFIVKVDGTAEQIDSLALGTDPAWIELTLKKAVIHEQTITVSLPPNGGCIKSAEGAPMASFDGKAVTNLVPAPAPTRPSKPSYTADVTTEDSTEEPTVPIPVTVDRSSGNASADIDEGQVAEGNTTVTMPRVPLAASYTVGIPVPDISTDEHRGTLTVETEKGDIVVLSNMLAGLDEIDGDKAQISIGTGDKDALSDDVRQAVGDRPLVQLGLSIDGRPTDWSNANAPVTLSIPYTPTAEELENPDAIVIWYIDGAGNAFAVPNGRYDEATGMVTFQTTHFSHFGVVFNEVVFGDVPDSAWYESAVNFIAARDITKGTGQGNFSPEAKLTRGEFIVLLMKAYELQPDTDPKDNFVDAGSTWYTGYLAAAKRLGVADGTGNDRFAPARTISRQEMFTLVHSALAKIDQLPKGYTGKTVDDFADGASAAPWANEALNALIGSGTIAGSGGKLNPADTTTRVEMAQVLYNLLTGQSGM